MSKKFKETNQNILPQATTSKQFNKQLKTVLCAHNSKTFDETKKHYFPAAKHTTNLKICFGVHNSKKFKETN